MNGKINKKKNSYISSEKLINDKTNSKNKKENNELIIIIIFSLFTYFSNLIYKLLIFTGKNLINRILHLLHKPGTISNLQ